MKTRNKKYISLLAVGIFLLVSACTVSEPIPHNNSGSIAQALRSGLRTNRTLLRKETRGGTTLQPSIQKALMPEIGLPNLLTEGGYEGEERDQQFDITVNNIPAKDFFMGLVKDTNYNMTINPQITGNISLELKSVTVPQAMEAVRNAYGFEFEKTSYGYNVFPRRLETRIFNINYLDINRGGQSQTLIGSGQITNTVQNTLTTLGVTTQQQNNAIPSGIIQTTSDTKFWETLKENLTTIVGTQEGRSVVINQKSGTAIVKAYPNELRAVAQYLDSLQNILHREVIIEAKILEVILNAQYQSGINWKLLGFNQGIPASTATTTTDSNSNLVSDALSNTPLFTSILNLNATYGNTFNAFIKLLNTQGKVNTLSSPRIATINNQKAVIKVGNDRFFVTNVTSNTNVAAAGTTGVTSNTITLTPFFSGISLDVTPQIDENDNITIHIHPIISRVTRDRQQFMVNDQQQDLPLAASSVRESDSVVHAKNGQVIVIGGLMESWGEDYTASTPGADRLPGINGLFKNNNKIALKRELVILLRPTITENTKDWQKQLRDAAIRVKKLNKLQNRFNYNIMPEKKIKTKTRYYH